ncbi:MAG TPA: hypothetical protein VGQ09_13360 [Chitinophagaceae bacterium]|jgi:biopolymer transport protein ExbD|nr:hypothetical protein [Chitinophagaceae bacterium]
MKKLISILIFVCIASFFYTLSAQVVKKTAQEVKKGAKKTANKTAEIASKGKARVTDKVYKDKVGPSGQTIYIDDHSKYYWIDKKGHRHYVTEAELKNKVQK